MNKMLDSLRCECGGKYKHVDQEQDDAGVVDSYQCGTCKTWCLVVWDPETEREIKREYSQDDAEDDFSWVEPTVTPFRLSEFWSIFRETETPRGLVVYGELIDRSRVTAIFQTHQASPKSDWFASHLHVHGEDDDERKAIP